MADAAGSVVKKIDFDSFGNIIDDTDPSFEVPFGFAGGLHDRDTGLVRFGFRDFDTDIGRWTAKDPILFAGGDTDLFGYCLNDPVNLVDPDGLYTWPYTWKGWAGVTLSLGGIALVPINPIAAGAVFSAGLVFSLWDAIEGPIDALEDAEKQLKPIREEMDQLEKELNEMEDDGKPCQ